MEDIIIKSPIKVICIKTNGSTKLIKGGLYYATSLFNSHNNKRVSIKGLNTYYANNFKLENGDCLDTHDNFKILTNMIDLRKNNYTGQYIRCNYSKSPYLKVGEIYFVEAQIQNYDNSFHDYMYYFKLNGIKNKVNSYQFDEIDISEQRLLKLKVLNGEEKINNNTRKFTRYPEKEKIKIFLEGLTKILSDINNIKNPSEININILNSIADKCKNYDVIGKDFEEYVNLDIKTILEMYNIKI